MLKLLKLFPARYVKKIFSKNNWTNYWKQASKYHHYHSTSHEVMGICKGGTLLLRGGENGRLVCRGNKGIDHSRRIAYIDPGRDNNLT